MRIKIPLFELPRALEETNLQRKEFGKFIFRRKTERKREKKNSVNHDQSLLALSWK